jgi:hypothetical protein
MDFKELNLLFRDLLSTNRGPGYDIDVTDAADDLSKIDVTVVFGSGRTYCCAEPGCHFLNAGSRLLRLAAKSSFNFPNNVVIQWHCCVEDGAKMECHKALGIPLESKAYEYDWVSSETH